MSAFSLDATAAVAFGIDLDTQTDHQSTFLKHARSITGGEARKGLIYLLFSKYVRFLPLVKHCLLQLSIYRLMRF